MSRALTMLMEAHDSLVELYKRSENPIVKDQLAECIALMQQAIEIDRKVSAACEPRARGGKVGNPAL